MSAPASVAVEQTAPGGTADIAVSMKAPNAPGSYTGNWRMRDPGGTTFGDTVRVVIAVPTPTPTPTRLPDLFVSEFSLDPATPTEGRPVSVRVGVYNRGGSSTGPFTVQWWAGENYPSPACTWRVDDGLVPRGGRILTCTYPGYPSWYGSITTKAVVDSNNEVVESTERDNTAKMTVSVTAASAALPDLFVSEFSLDPSTPTEGRSVSVRVGVYNRGNTSAGAFYVEWWAGENYPSPARTWLVNGLVARGGRILTYTYAGYPSWYGRIITKAVVDPQNVVAESEEGNNTKKMTISVHEG